MASEGNQFVCMSACLRAIIPRMGKVNGNEHIHANPWWIRNWIPNSFCLFWLFDVGYYASWESILYLPRNHEYVN